MQEVFENIIEKLNSKKAYFQRFYECEGKSEHDADLNKSTQLAFDDAIEIVKHEAEKFGTDTNVGSNGWIPCSERLPEEHKLYDITFKNSAGIHSDSAIYNPYLKRWLWDADETELVENEILAWAEKREPYQPKGE